MPILKLLFFALVVRPFFWLVTGFHVHNAARLPKSGPAIIVANHNSHLDAFALASTLPLRSLGQLRAISGVDYFARSRVMSWFGVNMLGTAEIDRRDKRKAWRFLVLCGQAIKRHEILIIFPEGTRGEPECVGRLCRGIVHLARRYPDVPIISVHLYGLGKVLPRGALLPLPYCCGANVGTPVRWSGDDEQFLDAVSREISGKTFLSPARLCCAAPEESPLEPATLQYVQ